MTMTFLLSQVEEAAKFMAVLATKGITFDAVAGDVLIEIIFTGGY